MCFQPEFGPLVGGDTCQSLGIQLWMPVMRNWEVIRNSFLTITESCYYNVWSTVIRLCTKSLTTLYRMVWRIFICPYIYMYVK